MSNPYIGEIRMFGGNFAPVNWAYCNGAPQSIAQNNALYALLGTTYGGDGVSTFNLPDLQSRMPIGQGTGPGLSTRTLGQKGGEESVTLTTSQMPAHNHAAVATSVDGTTSTPGGGVIPAAATGHSPQLYIRPGTQALNVAPMASYAIGYQGGSQPHENRQPCLGLTFCIALQGIFPSRS